MPPLLDTLYDETKTKLERIERRLNDAASFQIPRLRNHIGTLALQQQYSAELREDLESCRRELQVGVVSLFLSSLSVLCLCTDRSLDTGDIC
jgi:hypothetical protein